MFESLPIPITYKIFDDVDPKKLYQYSMVSIYFNKIINSDEFIRYKIERTKLNLINQNPELNENDAYLATSSLLGLSQYIQKYIDVNANVNVKLFFNKTLVSPIHLAAYSGNLSSVKMLVKNKADILAEKSNFDSDTPLHYAVAGGSVLCTQYFLDSGVPINQPTGFSWLGSYWTALEISANAGHPSCCELLLKRGADVQYKDPADYQPIHRASDSGCIESLRLLISFGADVNTYNEDGVTPLQIAIRNEDSQCIKFLLSCCADARSPNHMFHHLLPLQEVVVLDYFEIAEILLQHDPTLINSAYRPFKQKFSMGDYTPLQLTAAWGETKWVEFLLKYNPDPDIRCPEGKTAIDYAQQNGHEHCVALLYDYMIEREFSLSTVYIK